METEFEVKERQLEETKQERMVALGLATKLHQGGGHLEFSNVKKTAIKYLKLIQEGFDD